MYLLLGGVGAVAASVVVLSNLGGSGLVVMLGALVLLLGMVSFMGYSAVKLVGALIAKRRG